jgi:hypothetical protein
MRRILLLAVIGVELFALSLKASQAASVFRRHPLSQEIIEDMKACERGLWTYYGRDHRYLT